VGAEVVNGYELWLATKLGVPPDAIVFNGPNKRDEELERAVELGVGLLVVDGLDELSRLEQIAVRARRAVAIALRICPDIAPRGRTHPRSLARGAINSASIFPVARHARLCCGHCVRETLPSRRMAHVGGVHDLESFEQLVAALLDFYCQAQKAGARPELIDIGGGLGTRASRELTTFEMLAYLGLGRMPASPRLGPDDLVERYAERVTRAVVRGSARRGIKPPALVLEPGRALTSDAQLLLLTVGGVRERPGVGCFALVDGGAMTVSMMFLSRFTRSCSQTATLLTTDAPASSERCRARWTSCTRTCRVRASSRATCLQSPMPARTSRLPPPTSAARDRPSCCCMTERHAWYGAARATRIWPEPSWRRASGVLEQAAT
jgi:diaminopimelate decarboxylase